MNIGPAEILVILVFALIIVGPDRLPNVGKTIGRALGQFRDAQDKVNQVINSDKAKEMEQNPFLALSKIGDALDPEDGKDEGASPQDGRGDLAPADTADSDGKEDADRENAVSGASGGESSTLDEKSAHRVVKLSDRESFTQRKLRLKAQAQDIVGQQNDASQDRSGVASEGPSDEASEDEGRDCEVL